MTLLYYTRKGGVVHTEILLPPMSLPVKAWAAERDKLAAERDKLAAERHRLNQEYASLKELDSFSQVRQTAACPAFLKSA